MIHVPIKLLQSCPTLQFHGLYPTRLLYPWDSPGENTGMGCHALLQGIFPTQGSNPRLLSLWIGWWVLYYYCHLGSHVKLYLYSKRNDTVKKEIMM